MISIKTSSEVDKMRKSGALAALVMKETLDFIHPQISTLQIEDFITSKINSLHAKPSFKGQDGYKFSSCISVNEEVVHGLPSKRTLVKGDVVSIDLGVLYDGYHSDMCGTVEVGVSKLILPSKNMDFSWKLEGGREKKFLGAGITALDAAIWECLPGNRIGDISHAMQEIIEQSGFFVVRDLVGHGIGRKLHEEPQIPCYGRAGTGPKLQEGMVIAVEIMYTKNNTPLNIRSDDWTFVTMDKSLSAMFEHTVAILRNGCEVLTKL